MTTTTIIIGSIIVLALAAFLFFRTDAGRQLIDQTKPKPDLSDPNNWVIGPIVNGENASLGMPLHPGPGFVIDMPTPQSQPHYVTTTYGSLTGKTRITMRVRVEGGSFFAKDGVSQASICLYFQRQFDDWRAIESNPPRDSDTEGFRWYATNNAVLPLAAGEYTLTAAFTDKWTALAYSDSLSKPSAFKAAMDNAGEVGFVLGGGDGWGHGIMATRPSKITVLSYEIT